MASLIDEKNILIFSLRQVDSSLTERCPLVPTGSQPLHRSSGEVLAVVTAHHAEAGSPAIRTVMLFVEMVFPHGGLCIFHLRLY